MEEIDWNRVKQLINQLYTSVDGLEEIFPDRHFTLDGHLVGSIGEVLAAYMFDLKLLTASTKGHDAITQDGRNLEVEIKFTQGDRVGIRHEAPHLLVLQKLRDGEVTVVYNGPGTTAWNAAGDKLSNGQRAISVARLISLNTSLKEEDHLPVKRQAPI